MPVEGRDSVGLLAAGVDACASESDAVVAGFKVLSVWVDKNMVLGPAVKGRTCAR